MKVDLQISLSDANVDGSLPTNQRQLMVSVSALPEAQERAVPLNLCLILDHSGSMDGQPLETVKKAAQQLIDQLSVGDRLSIITFDHRAKVLVENQEILDPLAIKLKIEQLQADGGTAIDEGLRLGIEELAKGKQDRISQAFLLTDGENEHGNNDRCLKLAELAASHSLTISSLGFGDHWNQDILERIADVAGGTLSYIQKPADATSEFNRLFRRAQAVALTNAHLYLALANSVRLADLKPISQVAPEVIELPIQTSNETYSVRLGDLMVDVPRLVLTNLYVGSLGNGKHNIGQVWIQYDDPLLGRQGLTCTAEPIVIDVIQDFRPNPNPEVQQQILALAKYRQTQIAETKLQQGDMTGAATMLQTAAKTALQMGDENAATVLQTSATRLQAGEELSEGDRKKTRIASKTVLQSN